MGSSLETLRFEVDNIPMLVSLGLWTEIDNLDHYEKIWLSGTLNIMRKPRKSLFSKRKRAITSER